MPADNATLKYAVIDGYREQLRGRYLLENVRRFGEFRAVSERKIELLRDYFLECIYPESQQRMKLDAAFDHMGVVIRSPRRLTPLMMMAVKTVWKLGVMFPSAVKAGAHSLEAYLETRRLEGEMLKYAHARGLTPRDVAKRETMIQMIAHVPKEEVIRFRTEVLKLFTCLSNVKLLTATVEIMDNSRALMESRPDLYDEEELAGFTLGHEILRRGAALFQQLKTSEFPMILRGIEAVEIDWYDRVLEEAASLR
ncbi:MAG: hypothetical protein K1Y02_05600 [Candidatus Hydrogenedentes bacterium]|nr:hypothetical protein [Candidatus Hydrogenedentota bacterium]